MTTQRARTRNGKLVALPLALMLAAIVIIVLPTIWLAVAMQFGLLGGSITVVVYVGLFVGVVVAQRRWAAGR